MAKILRTVDAVFDALGGISGMQDMLGAKYTRVQNWRSFGKFPTATYCAIKSALAAKGLDADESLWPEMLELRAPPPKT